jgi:hypothetical protein
MGKKRKKAKKQESMGVLSGTICYFNNLSQSLTAIIIYLKKNKGDNKILKLLRALRERVDKKLIKLREEFYSRDNKEHFKLREDFYSRDKKEQ